MPSATPRVDVSATWPTCPACPHKHRPNSVCPPSNRWLIAGTPVDQPYPRLLIIRGPK